MDAAESVARRVNPLVEAGEVDHCGVPVRFFGHHDERFWALLGRTVAVSALLEDRLVALLQTMTDRPQDAYANLRMDQVATKLVAASARSDDAAWTGFDIYVARSVELIGWRNGLAHSLWPAQGESSMLVGHRLNRKGAREVITSTLDKVQQYLLELVALNEQWQQWFALASTEAGRRITG